MRLKESFTQEGKPNTIRLEAIEEFVEGAIKLETAVNKIDKVLKRLSLNKELEKASPSIILAFSDIKKAIKDLT